MYVVYTFMILLLAGSFVLITIKIYIISIKYIIKSFKFTIKMLIIKNKVQKHNSEQCSTYEKSYSKRLIQGNKIICKNCGTKNGLKREYCWMCAKRL